MSLEKRKENRKNSYDAFVPAVLPVRHKTVSSGLLYLKNIPMSGDDSLVQSLEELAGQQVPIAQRLDIVQALRERFDHLLGNPQTHAAVVAALCKVGLKLVAQDFHFLSEP